jgi:hypothetical protein
MCEIKLVRNDILQNHIFIMNSLTFCSMYLSRIETKFNRGERNYNGGKDDDRELFIFSTSARPFN